MRYRRKTQSYVLCILMYGALVYMCILTMVLHHKVFTEHERESQIVNFNPGLYTVEFRLERNSSMEPVIKLSGGNKAAGSNNSFNEDILSNEFIAGDRLTNESRVFNSSNYKPQLTTTVLLKINITTSTTVLNKTVLRKWDKSHTIVFMHIGKNGGTSFDATISKVCTSIRARYTGHRHFDWSYIDTIRKPDVLVLLREPVSRAVSHFHFATKKRILKTKGNISDYLKTPQNMLEARDIWQDGQAAVSWLTGTHIANWVGIKPKQIEAREIQSLDHKKMCTLAADRLKQTLWFGFLSDQERSLEMLQWQLGYSKTIKLSYSNRSPHPDISARDREILESLMPMDIWLYNYAELLFEARWQQYKTGIYREPELPPFPEINCKSTRYILACNKKAPLGPLYHVWNLTKETANTQMKLLPKDGWI